MAGSTRLVIAILFTTTLFILDDAAKYVIHRALHRIPLLWCFHRVHHTAETLTPFTVYRTHPVEGIIFALRAIFVQALAIGVFFFFFGDRVELLTLLGANIFSFFFQRSRRKPAAQSCLDKLRTPSRTCPDFTGATPIAPFDRPARRQRQFRCGLGGLGLAWR